jgi:hypothetical protein
MGNSLTLKLGGDVKNVLANDVSTVDAHCQSAKGISNMKLDTARPSAVAGIDDCLRGGG